MEARSKPLTMMATVPIRPTGLIRHPSAKRLAPGLRVTRRRAIHTASARKLMIGARIETLNQLRHIVFTATPEIRARFTGLTPVALTNKARSLRPRNGDDAVRYVTLVTIRALGHRVQYLREETKQLNRLLRPLIRQTAPTLLDVYGVGYDTAAKLLVAAGDNPERIHSEAAWAHFRK